MKLSTSLFALAAIGVVASSTKPLLAQNALGNGTPLGFSQLSTAKIAPARLQLKNLNAGWQRMTVESDENDPLAAIYGGFRGPAFADALTEAGIGVYFTRGQTATLGSETFLVAYRVETNMTAQDIQNLFRNIGGHGNNAGAMAPRKFPPDTTLLLSLLNLRTIGSLKDVRPFNAKSEIMGPSDVIELSNENLQELGRLLTQLSQTNRYGQQTPPLRDPATLRRTLDRYFHPRLTIFVHPQTKEPYRTNALLARDSVRLASNRSRLVAIYEAKPGTDGKYGTVFLDGHVERIPASRWKAVRSVVPQKPVDSEIRRLSNVNLKQLHSQLVRFARSNGGRLPSMRDAGTTRREFNRRLGNYNAAYFNHPITREAYRPNAELSGKTLKQIANPSRVVAFYEPTPASNNTRGAVFLDGRIERIPTANWSRARAVRAVVVRFKAPVSAS